MLKYVRDRNERAYRSRERGGGAAFGGPESESQMGKGIENAKCDFGSDWRKYKKEIKFLT